MSTNEQATVRKWTVWVTDEPGGKPRSITAEFAKEEWQILEAYDEYATELFEIDLVKKGGPGQVTMNFDQKKGICNK